MLASLVNQSKRSGRQTKRSEEAEWTAEKHSLQGASEHTSMALGRHKETRPGLRALSGLETARQRENWPHESKPRVLRCDEFAEHRA